MPKAKPAKAKLDQIQLAYLAGIWEATVGLKSVNSISAAAISREQNWPRAMSEVYGGEAKQFTSGGGKVFWGWFVPMELRVEILDTLRSAGSLLQTSEGELESIRAKLVRATKREESSDA